MDKPVSLLIKGPSGSGKSFALNAGLSFVPEEAYELYHGMSEKALIYNPKLDLRNRYLVIQEAAGINKGEGRTFLRQLLSEGKVRYATVQSTKDGLEGVDLPPIEGPMGLMMTTTANALHPEDESRMLSVHIDESPERTRAILAVQAGIGKRADYKPNYRVWHALHEFVGEGEMEVDIPFAEKLAQSLPLTHHRVSRDFPQLQSLIRAHALMHQCSREKGENGSLIATVDDYAVVYRLVSDLLAQGLEAAVPERIREVVEAVRELTGGPLFDVLGVPNYKFEGGVSQRQIAEAIDRDQSVVSRNVAAAVKGGYLTNRFGILSGMTTAAQAHRRRHRHRRRGHVSISFGRRRRRGCGRGRGRGRRRR